MQKSSSMLTNFGVIGYESLRNLGFPFPSIERIEAFKQESLRMQVVLNSIRQPVKRKREDEEDHDVINDAKVFVQESLLK